MREGRVAVWVAAFLVAATVQAGPGKDPKAPPELFLLEVDGKPVPIEIDKPLVIGIGDRKVKLRLTARPYRVLTAGGVRFRYPRGLVFEYDGSEGIPSWSLDSPEFAIMLHKQEEGEAGDVLAEFVEAILSEYEQRKTRVSGARIELGGREFAGRRIDTVLAGEKVSQEVFVIPHAKATYLLILQFFPEDGEIPADAAAAFKLLRESFRFLPAGQR